MTTLSEPQALLSVIAEACALARNLIVTLKRDAEIFTLEPAPLPAELAVNQDNFFVALNRVLEEANKHIAILSEPDVSKAFGELQTLIAEIKIAPLDSLIEIHPDKAEFYYKRAGVLFSLGRDADARRDYETVLQKIPSHFGALNDLGILQMESGDHTGARLSFAESVKFNPTLAIAHINYADFLLLQCEYQTAISHYSMALELDTGLNKAHQGLSHAYIGLGEEQKAAEHREAGFRHQALISWPYRGTGKPVQILILGSAFGGNIPLDHILDKRTFQSTIILTEYFNSGTPLPNHNLIINFIGDADLSRQGLDVAEALLARCSSPIINHPALVRPTGRLINARRLGVLQGVKTPRMVLLSRLELTNQAAESLLAKHGISFPLLLRSPGFHTGQYFVRVDEPGDLAKAAVSLPGEDLLVIQFLDSRNPQGDSHKFRVMFVDGKLYPLHLAISKQWKIHYFSADMQLEPEYQELEMAFLEDMPALLGEKVMTALENIRQVLGLDYGGIDFAIGQDGDVLLFEANATMLVRLSDNNGKESYRQLAIARIIEAVRTMIVNRAMHRSN